MFTAFGKSTAHPKIDSDGPIVFLRSCVWFWVRAVRRGGQPAKTMWQTARVKSAASDCDCAELLVVERQSSQASRRQENIPV